jgi:hypothetical protein
MKSAFWRPHDVGSSWFFFSKSFYFLALNEMQRLSSRLVTKAATSAVLRRVAPKCTAPCVSFAPIKMAVAMRFASLQEVATAELQEERQRDDRVAIPAPPSGWALTHTDGTSTFEMTKTVGNESLTVRSQLVRKDPEVVESGGDKSELYPFTLYVTRKDGTTLDFSLCSVDNELVVDNVAVLKDKSMLAKDTAELIFQREQLYEGPFVPELNEELVNALCSFLEERGVDDSFAEFIAQYHYAMEEREYEGWLQTLATW